jgi:hypothetical protein
MRNELERCYSRTLILCVREGISCAARRTLLRVREKREPQKGSIPGVQWLGAGMVLGSAPSQTEIYARSRVQDELQFGNAAAEFDKRLIGVGLMCCSEIMRK